MSELTPTTPKAMTIVKADGEVQVFDTAKLSQSLVRAGASNSAASRIAQTIFLSGTGSVSSKEVYRKAFSMLRRESRPSAARYNLRKALLEFGPSGHPFEDFVAELFKAEGWNVSWRNIIQGRCVPHEVDLYGTRGEETIAGELKYHNDAFYKTDVKVALYVKARFDDIAQCEPGKNTCKITSGYLITNTKFTKQAIDFGACSGLILIGWNYPSAGNLYDRIVASGIYPVTTLTSLKRSEKRLLMQEGIVTSQQLQAKREALRTIGIPPARIGSILSEIEALHSPLISYGTTP